MQEEIKESLCDWCDKKYDGRKKYYRWDFTVCSMKCLKEICRPRLEKEEKEEERLLELNRKNSMYSSYSEGGGSAF